MRYQVSKPRVISTGRDNYRIMHGMIHSERGSGGNAFYIDKRLIRLYGLQKEYSKYISTKNRTYVQARDICKAIIIRSIAKFVDSIPSTTSCNVTVGSVRINKILPNIISEKTVYHYLWLCNMEREIINAILGEYITCEQLRDNEISCDDVLLHRTNAPSQRVAREM